MLTILTENYGKITENYGKLRKQNVDILTIFLRSRVCLTYLF
jgi:hypothetical protein